MSLLLTAAPAAAQSGTSACAKLAGTERVACLRKLLADAQEELQRAEQALDPSVPARPAPTQTARPEPARAQDTQQLGEEQVARRAGIPSAAEDQRFAALIISSEQTRPNRLLVTLENGQVWRQLQSDTQIVELSGKKPVSAEIWRSGFGGYRMRLSSIGRVLKVERMR